MRNRYELTVARFENSRLKDGTYPNISSSLSSSSESELATVVDVYGVSRVSIVDVVE